MDGKEKLDNQKWAAIHDLAAWRASDKRTFLSSLGWLKSCSKIIRNRQHRNFCPSNLSSCQIRFGVDRLSIYLWTCLSTSLKSSDCMGWHGSPLDGNDQWSPYHLASEQLLQYFPQMLYIHHQCLAPWSQCSLPSPFPKNSYINSFLVANMIPFCSRPRLWETDISLWDWYHCSPENPITVFEFLFRFYWQSTITIQTVSYSSQILIHQSTFCHLLFQTTCLQIVSRDNIVPERHASNCSSALAKLSTTSYVRKYFAPWCWNLKVELLLQGQCLLLLVYVQHFSIRYIRIYEEDNNAIFKD